MGTKRRTLDELRKRVLSDPVSKRNFEMLGGENLVLSERVKAHKATGLDKVDIKFGKMKVI